MMIAATRARKQRAHQRAGECDLAIAAQPARREYCATGGVEWVRSGDRKGGRRIASRCARDGVERGAIWRSQGQQVHREPLRQGRRRVRCDLAIARTAVASRAAARNDRRAVFRATVDLRGGRGETRDRRTETGLKVFPVNE
jgi:hypothetical protein